MDGKHRQVPCHCEMATVSRQVYVENTIEKLRASFELSPNGRPWIEEVLQTRPDLRDRLRLALGPS